MKHITLRTSALQIGFHSMIRGLTKLERLILEYFVRHISVGEIIAVIDLREEVKRLRDPELVSEFDDPVIEMEINKAIAKLVEKGYLERATGCFNLSESLRMKVIEKYGSLKPGEPKSLNNILE